MQFAMCDKTHTWSLCTFAYPFMVCIWCGLLMECPRNGSKFLRCNWVWSRWNSCAIYAEMFIMPSLFCSIKKKNLKTGFDKWMRSLRKLINMSSLSHRHYMIHKHVIVTPFNLSLCPRVLKSIYTCMLISCVCWNVHWLRGICQSLSQLGSYVICWYNQLQMECCTNSQYNCERQRRKTEEV